MEGTIKTDKFEFDTDSSILEQKILLLFEIRYKQALKEVGLKIKK